MTDDIFYDDGMSRPTYINVGSPTSTFEPVIDVSDAWFSPRKTTYQVSFDAGYGRKEKREPIVENLMHKYFPFYIIDELVNASNRYHMERKLREPHLFVWKCNFSAPITHSNISTTSLLFSNTVEYTNSHAKTTTGSLIHLCQHINSLQCWA